MSAGGASTGRDKTRYHDDIEGTTGRATLPTVNLLWNAYCGDGIAVNFTGITAYPRWV